MLVKPRISMSLAALTAATLTKPTSLVSTAACGTVANMMCVWASISPGISVRPPPAMRVTAAPGGGAIGGARDCLDDVADHQDVRRRREPVGGAVEDADVLEDHRR